MDAIKQMDKWLDSNGAYCGYAREPVLTDTGILICSVQLRHDLFLDVYCVAPDKYLVKETKYTPPFFPVVAMRGSPIVGSFTYCNFVEVIAKLEGVV